MSEAARAAKNTDRELYRDTPDDYYAPSLHVTEGGGIGINVGGTVYVMPLRAWHALVKEAEQTAGLRAALEEEHRAVVMLRALPEPDGAWSAHESGDECSVCALLADSGQAGEDLSKLLRLVRTAHPGSDSGHTHHIGCETCDALAAVEKARGR